MDALFGLGKSLFGSSNDDDHTRDRESMRESLRDHVANGNQGMTSSEQETLEEDQVLFSPSRILSLKNVKHYTIPNNDFCKYLQGPWKRNLDWREFGGGFSHLRTSNVCVLIEQHQKLDSELGARYLKWSFGRTLSRNELRTAYTMKCVMQSKSSETQFEWQYSGVLCTGRFYPTTGVAILNFIVKSSCVTVTYRLIDADSMGVCIVEVDEQKVPTIQYGTMYRIDPALYR